MMPRPSMSGITHASVTSARSLRSNFAQLARTHPLKKCVTGLISVRSARLRRPSNMAAYPLFQVNKDFAILDLDGIGLQLLIGMIHGDARLRVPSPAVPGADHLAVFDHSLSERAALMQALVIHGAELAPNVGNADHFSVAGEVSRFVGGGQMGLGNDLDEGHSRFSVNTKLA